MACSKDERKKGLVLKALERCRSLGRQRRSPSPVSRTSPRSADKYRVAPEGHIIVCVGADKERFAIKMECTRHPLFKLLLDEAEREYGFSIAGPLELPCNVYLFNRVLQEIEQENVKDRSKASPVRRFARGFVGYRILSPSRLVITG